MSGDAHIAYYWTLPAAGAVCFVVGIALGLPALRLQGLYLALATFALAVALPQLLKSHLLEELTGGVQGIVVDKPDPPPGLPLDPDQWLYYFTLAVLLVMFAGAASLVRSRTGRAIMAIRDHPTAAAAMGINAALYKTLTFGVSALYTGVAGALGAIVVQFVAPDSFNFLLSVSFLVGLIVGGIGSIPGSLFGGVFVLYVPNIAESVSTGLSGAIYGVILLLVIFIMPSGAAGFARGAAGWLARLGRRPKTASSGAKGNEADHPPHGSGRDVGDLGARRPILANWAGPRRQGLRPRRHRHRDQDRQHRPLQRPVRQRQRYSPVDGRLLQNDQ
jgi:branched-chain amino acid transport system permease protein